MTLADRLARDLDEQRRSHRQEPAPGSTIEDVLGLTLPFTTAGEREIVSQLAQLRDQHAAAFKVIASQLQTLIEAFREVAAKQVELEKEIKALPQKADFDSLVREIDAETNAIGQRLDGLTQQLIAAQKAGDGSISAADSQAILDALTAESARLKVLGSNPADPIPNGPGATTGPDQTAA